MNNILNLLTKMDEYITYLEEKGIKFNELGFPILTKEMFIREIPEIIIPYTHRNDNKVIDKKKTLLCTFDSDQHIYPRINKIFEDINEYKKYLGVVMSDITVTDDMDIEWQLLIILLNQLYMAILAVNGIKVAFNTRIGSLDTINTYISIPKNIICVSSFLGCSKSKEYDLDYITKILYLRPSYLLIYGKEDRSITEKLNEFGINYRYYKDFHSLCKKGGK